MSAPTLEPATEDAIRDRARGQIDNVRLHKDHANRVLDELRLAAENLLSIHQRAMSTLDEVPAYDVSNPERAEDRYADPQGDVRLSSTVLSLLASFGSSKVDDLIAGIDATQAALGRYADVAEAAYDREFGTGWRPAQSSLPYPYSLALLDAVIEDRCPAKDCEEKGAHGLVRVTDDGLEHLSKSAPSASGPVECCASGSCEVCRPGAGWDSNELARGVDL